MTTNFVKRGVEIIKQAIEKDHNKQYSSALILYHQGVEYLKTGLKYESSEKVKKNIQSKIDEYTQRANDIRQSLEPNTSTANITNKNSENSTDHESIAKALFNELNDDDIEPNASINYISKGTELIKKAVQNDNAEEYEIAITLYSEGVEYLLKGLKYEHNAMVISAIQTNIQKYLKRAEDIKRSLQFNMANMNDSDDDDDDEMMHHILKEAGIDLNVKKNKNIIARNDEFLQKLLDDDIGIGSNNKQFIDAPIQTNAATLVLIDDKTIKIRKLEQEIKDKDEEINKIKTMNMKQQEVIDDLRIKLFKMEQEHETKGNEDMNIKQQLLNITATLNQFGNIFNDNTLRSIYKQSPEVLCIVEEMQNAKLSASNYVKKLSDIELCINSLDKPPDPLKYEEWDLDIMIKWIDTLENGRFKQYIDIIRSGFKEDGIVSGVLLPSITRSDLRADPFNIKDFAVGKSLEAHFKSLKKYGNIEDNLEMEGAQTDYIGV